MSDNQPRSIRLTKEHRSDMVRAVMQEWVKQHPKPTASVSFHAAVADQVKLSVQYKRTARVVPVLQPGDEKCLKVNECVLITITDSEGNHRNSLQIEYPPVLADRLGLVGIDLEQDEYTFSMDRQGQIDGTLPDAYRGLTTSDIVDGSTRVVESDTGREARVRSRRWVGERIVVQISDDSNAYKAYQAARKAQNEWEGEAHRLRRETADLLDQFNTTKQIRDGWPAMVPYFPPHIADPESVVHLPVLAVDRLSERLGIK